MLEPCVVAIGGGGFSEDGNYSLLDDYILSLSPKPAPHVCFIPTASGDAAEYIVKFYAAFMRRDCRPSHLSVLQGLPTDIEEFVLSQNVLYVGGGNTITMLAAWRALGIDVLLEKAWRQGTVMCGLSAGSMCWFESGPSTALQIPGLVTPLLDCLGFIPGSHCSHFDIDLDRKTSYKKFVADEVLPSGWAADSGVALRFKGKNFAEAVTDRVDARAWRIERQSHGVAETGMPTRLLRR